MNKLSTQSNPLFFSAIKANAVFSGLCGLLMAIFSNAVNNFMEARVFIDLIGIGIFLVVFSCWLLYLAWKNSVSRMNAWAIVGGDLLWVLFTLLLITCYMDAFSMNGLLLIGFTGLVVGIFAALQAFSLLKESQLEKSIS